MIINIAELEPNIVLQLCFLAVLSSLLPFPSSTYPTIKAYATMTADAQANASITKAGKESVHRIRAAPAYAELSGTFI